jgi:UDP:flavonoid glycosyltransferase YjiC (YdhE family)
VACSPSIIVVPPDLPAATRVTGAWLDRGTPAPLPPALDAFLADGPPPIVVAFGSMSGAEEAVLDAALDAVLASGRRLVLQGGVGAAISSANAVQIGSVDHRALFPRAALVVHHGGAGTTHAACAAGIPSVVVPHVGDQRYWADRLKRLGVAPDPLPVAKIAASSLPDAILTVAADPGLRERAGQLANALAREDGIGESVRALEALVV